MSEDKLKMTEDTTHQDVVNAIIIDDSINRDVPILRNNSDNYGDPGFVILMCCLLWFMKPG